MVRVIIMLMIVSTLLTGLDNIYTSNINIPKSNQQEKKELKKKKGKEKLIKDNKNNGDKKTIKELIAMNPPVNYVKGYVGKKYPSEWREHATLIDGFKVMQLTTSPAEDSKFYLTTDSYFPELNVVAFVSNRTSIWNIFYCDLATGELTQVTDFPNSTNDDGHGDICSFRTNEIIYYDKPNLALRKVNLITFQDTKLYSLPLGYKRGNSFTSNSDGSIIAITAIMGEKGDVESSRMIFLNVDGSGVREIERPGQQLSHVNLNTSGETPGVIYARKEIEDVKMFFYMSLDGKIDKKIVEAKGKGEGVSHPFWTPDGSKACYLKKRRGKDPKYWLGFYELEKQMNFEYEKEWDADMSANFDASLFVGTGNHADPCLKFWRIEGDKIIPQRVFVHGATFPGPECRDVHNTFISGTNNVIFNSDGDGNGNVYVLIEEGS